MSKLSALAADMRRCVGSKPFGKANVTLDGLEIGLSHIDERWRLTIRRERVYPSQVEQDILTDLFGVAQGCQPEPNEKTETNPKTGRPVLWCGIVYNWIEADTASAHTARLPRYASTVYPPA